MKAIGLIGGMSWESTVTYYEELNNGVKRALGGLHSAPIWLYSVDFAPIEACQKSGDWDKTAEILGDAAKHLEACGAQAVLICTNTMHKVADQVQQRISVPLVHIATATAQAVKRENITRVGLLGTKYTVKEDFYTRPLIDAGLDVLIGNDAQIEEVNRIIFEELCLGEIRESSRRYLQGVMADFEKAGAQGVILGCTEIGLLVKEEDTSLKVFDTTLIHAAKALEIMLEDEKAV